MMCVSNLSLGKTPGILLRTHNLSTVKNFLSGTIDPVAYFSNRILFQLHTFSIAYLSRILLYCHQSRGNLLSNIIDALAYFFCLHSFQFAYFSVCIFSVCILFCLHTFPCLYLSCGLDMVPVQCDKHLQNPE